MQYISRHLTHWAGRSLPEQDRLQLLLTNILAAHELLFSFSSIAFSSRYGGLTAKDTWGLQMVCFTDMPLSASATHCAKYSKFGISLNKGALANCCVAPVAYILNPFIYSAYSFLYHQLEGIKSTAEGLKITQGKHTGMTYSAEKMMQALHAFISWSQDYSGSEFPYLESNLVAVPEMESFFDSADSFYYEREWRAIYRPGDKFGWVAEHDDKQFFRFDHSSVRRIIVSWSSVDEARCEIKRLFPATPVEVVAFEDLELGQFDE